MQKVENCFETIRTIKRLLTLLEDEVKLINVEPIKPKRKSSTSLTKFVIKGNKNSSSSEFLGIGDSNVTEFKLDKDF